MDDYLTNEHGELADLAEAADTVTVTVEVSGTFEFEYGRHEWEAAKAADELHLLMDWDLSDMDPDVTIYGPDGERI